MKNSFGVRFFPIILLMIVLVLAGACNPDDVSKAPGVTYTIGIMNSVSAVDMTIDAFKVAMADFGYVEGDNVTYLYEGAVRDEEVLRNTAQLYVDEPVDLIVSLINSPTLIAKEVTETAEDGPIPIVFGTVINPDETGLVESLKEPGGNLTGVSTGSAELAVARRLEWLVKAVPDARRVYVPYAENSYMPAIWAALQETAQAFEVELVPAVANSPEEVEELLDSMPEDIDAMLYLGGRAFQTGRQDLFALAYERKLPIVVNSVNLIEEGVLLAFAQDSEAIGVQMARLADQILQGADPGSLPVEAPELFLTVNLETADELGIDVSDEVLEAARTILRAEGE